MAARFVTSIGSGFSIVVTSVYNTEISPSSTRGLLLSFLEVCIICARQRVELRIRRLAAAHRLARHRGGLR
uniref:Uncharacterized protein n=1 Tax=Arundo donax TaxID=35708 RepID=A0A0A9AN23_ARUDO